MYLNLFSECGLQGLFVGLWDDAAGKSHLDGFREALLHEADAPDFSGESHFPEDEGAGMYRYISVAGGITAISDEASW